MFLQLILWSDGDGTRAPCIFQRRQMRNIALALWPASHSRVIGWKWKLPAERLLWNKRLNIKFVAPSWIFHRSARAHWEKCQPFIANLASITEWHTWERAAVRGKWIFSAPFPIPNGLVCMEYLITSRLCFNAAARLRKLANSLFLSRKNIPEEQYQQTFVIYRNRLVTFAQVLMEKAPPRGLN